MRINVEFIHDLSIKQIFTGEINIMEDYFICPNCGADVKPNSLACRECGADENTGWSEETMYDGLDLPDVEEDIPKSGSNFFWNRYFLFITAIICLFAFIFMFVL